MSLIESKNILVIYDHRRPIMRLTIKQHLMALEQSGAQHKITYLNFANLAPSGDLTAAVSPLPEEVRKSKFNAVILHYSFLSLRTVGRELFEKWKKETRWISDFDCQIIAIPQDEADHAGILDDWLFELGVDTIFSVHYKPDGPLYPQTRKISSIYNCLPGYIDEESARDIAGRLRKHQDRPFDVVYRGRSLPYWYGSHAQLKGQISEEFQNSKYSNKFKTDISTYIDDAVEGERWLDFLASSRGVLGIEGGLSTLDQAGELKMLVEAMIIENPKMTFMEISRQMPKGWDDYRFLTITPRHFEAVITKTCQVLVEGEYKGILEAGKHYIPIKPDFSNLNEVFLFLEDRTFCENIAEIAYDQIYKSKKYSYRNFASLIEQTIKN